jgi:ankyrin repeat protein
VPGSTAEEVARTYFDALGRGDIPTALGCLAQDIEWVNLAQVPGVSDIIPWLGTCQGIAEVARSFQIRDQVVKIKVFKPLDLVVDGNRAVGTINDQATVVATGLDFDITFATWLTISGGKITHWKSYCDPSPIVAAFRGDLSARLREAVDANDAGAVEYLLSRRANPNARDPQTGLRVLMMAACRGNAKIVALLLEAGADFLTTDAKTGATALHKAGQGGNLEVARLLLQYGAFIDAVAPTTGHTPLMEALWYKWPDLVKLLVENGQDLNLATHYGFTLDDHIAFELNVNQGEDKRKYEKIKEYIEEGRAAARDDIAAQTVMAAVNKGDLETIKLLIASGADVNTVYPHVNSFLDGHTPLLVAARDKHTEIAGELLRAGAKVRVEDWVFKGAPIHKATYNGNLAILKMLVAHPDIDLNVQGPINGYTPLHDALWHGYEDCARAIIEAGARLDLKGHDGKTVLHLACEVLGEKSAVAELIRSRLAG